MHAQTASNNGSIRWFGLPLLWATILTSTGCLDFERQTALLVFVPDKDEIRALFVYEGLHVSGGSPQNKKDHEKIEALNLKKAREDLATLVQGDAFYLGDPFLRIALQANDKTPESEKQLIALLKKHVTIDKGFFVTGEKLSYCQPITVRDPGKMLAGINDMISTSIAASKEPKEKDPTWDAETFQLLQKAARDKHAWLKLEPGRLNFTLPATPKFVAAMKRGMLGLDRFAALRKQGNTNDQWKNEWANLERLLTFAAENPWSLDVRSKQVTLALGYGAGEPILLVAPGTPRPRAAANVQAGLTTHARTLGAPLRDGVTLETILADFQRDAEGRK